MWLQVEECSEGERLVPDPYNTFNGANQEVILPLDKSPIIVKPLCETPKVASSGLFVISSRSRKISGRFS